MLEARHISLEIPLSDQEEPLYLLRDVNFCVPKGHFMAIVGPSGCGKSTLLKTIAGIKEATDGEFHWSARNLEEEDFEPGEVGYVPQFSIAYEELTVDENIESAARLRVAADEETLNALIDDVLEETGLVDIADRPVKLLSGGQKRRLALAMELVSHPRLLLCDEVTSGLDPNSEREIVELLHQLSRREGRIVISVTHSLAQMELYDSLMVLYAGALAYHGAPDTMNHYFGVTSFEEVYPLLYLRDNEGWKHSWLKHRKPYYLALEEAHRQRQAAPTAAPTQAPTPSKETLDEEMDRWALFESKQLNPVQKAEAEAARAKSLAEQREQHAQQQESSSSSEPHALPSVLSQTLTMLQRRFNILLRDRSQLTLQIAMIVIFPILVALFSGKGIEQLLVLTDSQSGDLASDIAAQQAQAEVRAQVGSAVSGIIMFQVILLGLMGSNNAAREIAGERLLMEKEKFGGASPLAYLGSKVIYLSILVLIQSLWMFLFVQHFWPLRGDTMNHLLFLILANAAMTSTCLAISANCRTPEQSSLLSIYLVGFQLPLSGAVLALPAGVAMITQPFISAYWAWSGSIEGGIQADVLKAIKSIVQTDFTNSHLCLIVLSLHIILGLGLSYIGVRRKGWD